MWKYNILLALGTTTLLGYILAWSKENKFGKYVFLGSGVLFIGFGIFTALT